ncbi:MAG: iron-sulfur cluster assembly scaffold protein [Oligoflexia bacterium]|nr:iron-sulfur cluster assembly scaffold protein [Oligoflexia bacterium]
MVWQYSNKTKQLFMDAVQGKAGTHLGEIQNPDGTGEHGSIACGDAMRFSFRVKKHDSDPLQDIITEVKYLTFGCTSAIASSEALCALIEQKQHTPLTALKITNKDIADYLDGLPDQKIHCSVMGAEALEDAVIDWAQKRGVNLKPYGINIHRQNLEEDHGKVICQCFSLTNTYIRKKIIELNLHSITDITNAIKAGGACGSCHHSPGGLQDLLDEIWGRISENSNNNSNSNNNIKNNINNTQAKEKSMSESSIDKNNNSTENTDSDNKTKLSPYQIGKKVEEVVNQKIRPALARDGGDMEVVDIKENIVYCRLMGACRGCMGATMTLKMMVERLLKEEVDENIKVISV